MKMFHPARTAIVATALTALLAAPGLSFAYEHSPAPGHAYAGGGFPGHYRQITPEERTQWVKKHLDREASMLEIKASQESAWEAYAAATLDLVSAGGEQKPLPANLDAAAMMRLHAEHASAFAQRLSALADATSRLQATLNDDQRKVLDRLVRLHSQFHGWHHHWRGHWQGNERRDGDMAPSAPAKGAPKAAPAKPKN